MKRESSGSRPKKKQRIRQSASVVESEDELSSQVSYGTASPPSTPLHPSFQYESQEETEIANGSHQSEENRQIAFDRSLKVPDIEILSNNIAKSGVNSLRISWVWSHMQRDTSKKQITCEVVMIQMMGVKKNVIKFLV